MDITPDDGNRMVMQTAPGWIASMSDFWLTSAGLAITETTIGGYDGFKGYDETRVPEFVRARKASQYARDIDHWVETLNTDNNGGYANSWLVGDVKTGEIARYERLTPFTPFGSVDGKVATSADIKALNLCARCGRADGTGFDADEFLRQHPQWDWQRGYLKDRPHQPWSYIDSGSTGGH